METKIAEMRALLPASVHEQLVAGGEPGLDTEVTLMRWLRARKMDPHQAATDLTKHAAWRAAWCPQQRVLEAEVQPDIQQEKLYLQGRDRHGRGVCILQGRKHAFTTHTSQQRFITYTIDGMIAACDTKVNPEARIVAVFELQSLSLCNMDAVGLKNIFMMLQQHYVEHLDKLFMVNASSIFWGLWRVVSPFIDPVTRAKIVFVDSTDVMVQELGPEVLPAHLGGTGELIPSEEGWRRVLLARQQQQQQQPAGSIAQGVTTGQDQRSSLDCGHEAAQQQQQRQDLQELAPHLRFSGPGGADAAVLIQTA